MSLKAIDMQFAVHKNDEAGIRQNQLMQKPRQDEAVLENQASQTTERDRQRSAKVEESAGAEIRDQGHRQQREEGGSAKERQEPEKGVSQSASSHEHPYKGHHIDLTL